jgi:two-component system response regulator RegX3
VAILAFASEPSRLDSVVAGLRQEHLTVSLATDERAVPPMFERVEPDLVLLDVTGRGGSGVDACRALRRRWTTPILVLARQSPRADPTVYLAAGADDYLDRPERVREVVARVRAVLRRTGAAGRRIRPESTMQVGDVRIDPAGHRVSVGEREVRLPRNQFTLLAVLVENAGRVLPRDTLISRVWGPEYPGGGSTLEVLVYRLRKSLGDGEASPARITTIRGVGYRIERR